MIYMKIEMATYPDGSPCFKFKTINGIYDGFYYDWYGPGGRCIIKQYKNG